MFITHDAFAIPFLSALSLPGTRYHRTVELSMRAPWVLVTFQTEEDGIQLAHTFLCSWDRDLVDVLIAHEVHTVMAVQQVFPRASDGNWGVRAIRQVWSAREVDSGQRIIVLQADDGQEFGGPMGDPITQACTDRTLIAEVGAGMRPASGWQPENG
ncbi:MAG: hypothetical protein ACOZD0_05550 [Pseudomonadota bacterium]